VHSRYPAGISNNKMNGVILNNLDFKEDSPSPTYSEFLFILNILYNLSDYVILISDYALQNIDFRKLCCMA